MDTIAVDCQEKKQHSFSLSRNWYHCSSEHPLTVLTPFMTPAVATVEPSKQETLGTRKNVSAISEGTKCKNLLGNMPPDPTTSGRFVHHASQES